MLELHTQVDALKEKLQELLKAYKHVRKENERLTKELESATTKHIASQIEIDQLNQKLAAIQLSNGNYSDAEKQALQKKIDAYLKEIDKCLALLHA